MENFIAQAGINTTVDLGNGVFHAGLVPGFGYVRSLQIDLVIGSQLFAKLRKGRFLAIWATDIGLQIVREDHPGHQ